MASLLEDFNSSLNDQYIIKMRDLKRFGIELGYITKALFGIKASQG